MPLRDEYAYDFYFPADHKHKSSIISSSTGLFLGPSRNEGFTLFTPTMVVDIRYF